MIDEAIQARAARLHRQAIIIDGHSDILNPLADGRMRLRDRVQVEPPDGWQGAEYARQHRQATPYQLSPYSMYFQCIGQYDIPRFREGGLTAQVMAIFLCDEHLGNPL